MKIPHRNFDLDSLQDSNGMSHVLDYFDRIKAAIGTHVDADKVYDIQTPPVANQEFKIAHGLKSKPQHFILVSKDGIGDLYKSVTAWTKTAAYFKCSGTSLKVRLLIW